MRRRHPALAAPPDACAESIRAAAPHDSAESAIAREKRIKKWNRVWKIRLIEESNPYWNDLYERIVS